MGGKYKLCTALGFDNPTKAYADFHSHNHPASVIANVVWQSELVRGKDT